MPSSNDGRVRKNSSFSIIQSIPAEVLTIIFSYVSSPSVMDPYHAYVILSWVCRRWRSIILETSNFWTVIRPDDWRKGPDFIRDILHRSKSRPLDIFTCRNNCCHNGCPWHYVISESSRIRSLSVQNLSLFNDKSTLQCPTSFPQLENLIFHDDFFVAGAQDTMHRVLLASRPRYIQFSGGVILKKHVQLSQNLSNVEWFKFHCPISHSSSLGLLTLFQVLQHLPNLKILNLIFPKGVSHFQRSLLATASTPVVTLPNLRMLSLDLWNNTFHSICTPPTLDYVGLSRFSRNIIHDWVFLDRIDLSMTKCYLVTLYDGESHLRCKVAQSLIARITMGDYDENNNNSYQVFERFHCEIPLVTSSVDSHLVLPPKNTFNIELHKFRDLDTTLLNHLKRALNLVQLTLDYRSNKSDADNKAVVSHLLGTLDTITHLKVLHCRNFSVICDILMEEGNVPRLERLTYHSSRRSRSGAAFVLRRLRMMKDVRAESHREPLKILEMRNFIVLSPEQIKEIEGMGIRFTQVSESSCGGAAS